MCDAVGELFRLGVSRRRFIRGVTAAAGGATLLSAAQAAAGTDENPTRRPMTAGEVAGNYACRLVLLGTAGGPTWQPNRQGIASAMIVDGRIYLVDCGEGTQRQLLRSGLGFKRLNNILSYTQMREIEFYEKGEKKTIRYAEIGKEEL